MKRREKALRDLDRDIQDHLERETADNIDRGMTPDEARARAVRKFGNVLRVQEETREVWSAVWLQQLQQDVRFGLRMLRRSPGFTTVVILTLALGIGMNTAVFSVVNAVLLRPLAYPDAERLVWMADYFLLKGDFDAWQKEAQSFDAIAGYWEQDMAVTVGDEASQERVGQVAGDFWKLTGVQPGLGRLFGAGERDGIVLSYGFFERRFGGEPGALGKTITVDGRPYTIVGVLPGTFRFLFPPRPVSDPKENDLYMPFPDGPVIPGQPVTQICAVARLKRGVTMDQARAGMQPIEARLALQHPVGLRRGSNLVVGPLQEKIVGSARAGLEILLAAVGFVLLIASVNIANLLLARASARQREIAVRAAMGAGRARVIRQFLAESTILALLGGVAGIAVARWAIALMVRLGPLAVPRLAETRIDGRVLAFTLAVSLGTGALFGLVPAITLWRVSLHDVLKDAARTASEGGGRMRIRGLLAAVELALAIVLLSGAGLLLKGFWRMNQNPAGFAPESILVMRVSLSGPQYRTRPPQDAYALELLRRIEHAPGVRSAGVEFGTLWTGLQMEGAPLASFHAQSPDDQPFAGRRFVSPGYLRALGVSLVQGRWPGESEAKDAVMINESLARAIGGDPIGRHIAGRFGGVVAGVVADFKYWKRDSETLPELYIPFERFFMLRNVKVVVRTDGHPMAAAPAIRKLVADIDRTQPVYELQTLEQTLSDSIAPRRFHLFLLGAFAATAVLLALVGIYGVIAYSVSQRTHEIGIRMALGARRGDVVGMVVRQGMGIALAGITAGLGAAAWLTRLMASLLYDVKPNDLPTFGAVAVTVAATALLAIWGPALKAALIDPIVALRYE